MVKVLKHIMEKKLLLSANPKNNPVTGEYDLVRVQLHMQLPSTGDHLPSLTAANDNRTGCRKAQKQN